MSSSRPPPITTHSSTSSDLYDDSTPNLPMDKPETPIIQLGPTRRVGLVALVPTFFTLVFSAGFASALIIWLLSKRVFDHPPNEDLFFRRAIVAIEASTAPKEGVDGSLTAESTLYGLAISSAASHLISLSVPFLMALVAYRVAADWLQDSFTQKHDQLPTPAQYGLLLKLCGSSNLFSAYTTCRYLWASNTAAPRAPASLKKALCALVFILVLTHTVGAADFWLHTTASSFLHINLEPLPDNSQLLVGTAINTTACPYPAPFLIGGGSVTNLTNCAAFQTASASNPVTRWGSSPAMVTEAVAAAGNQSQVNAVVLIKDIAVLLPKSMPPDVNDVILPTFGLTTQCSPVSGCELDPPDQSFLRCSSFSPPFEIRDQALESIGEYNITDNRLLTNGYPINGTINPYGALIQLTYASDDDVQVPEGTPGWYQLSRPESSPPQFFVASCAITAYNITLVYSPSNSSNSSSPYALAAPPLLSNFNTTSALLAAYGTSLSQRLTTYLHSTLEPSINMSSDPFFSLLSESVSIASLGLASPLMERTTSISAKSVTIRSANRYPLAPLCTVMATLYAYALLALVLCIWTALSTSNVIIVQAGDSPNPKTPRSTTTLELAQLRLTDPLALVAQHFALSNKSEPTTSLKTSALDMFDERGNEERLTVGLLPMDGDSDGVYRRKAFSIRRAGVTEEEIPLQGST